MKKALTITMLTTVFSAAAPAAMASPTADAYDESQGARDVIVMALGLEGGALPATGSSRGSAGRAVTASSTVGTLPAHGPVAQAAAVPFTAQDAGWLGLAAVSLGAAGVALIGTGVTRRFRLERYDDV